LGLTDPDALAIRGGLEHTPRIELLDGSHAAPVIIEKMEPDYLATPNADEKCERQELLGLVPFSTQLLGRRTGLCPP
jgi:hypothetical protein